MTQIAYCYICKHLNKDTGTCSAFPNEIPYKYFFDEKHTKIDLNQIGEYIFEQKEIIQQHKFH